MKFWSVRTLAERADTSIQWVHEEIGNGKFPGIEKVGNSYVISYDEGVAWLKSRGIEVDDEKNQE